MLTTLGWACEELFGSHHSWASQTILIGEGDLYDIHEYHMLAHIIIRNKVDDFGTICSRLYSIYVFCVFRISKLTNIYSYSMNAPLSLFCFCHGC